MSQPARALDFPTFAGDPKWLPPTLLDELREKKRLEHIGSFSRAEKKIMRKRPPISVSAWAERHRVVTMSKLAGPWRNEVTPYLAGVMDAIAFPSIRTVIVCKAPQIGGSEAIHNFVGWAIDRSPGPVLYVYPDALTARENSKDRILPMIEASPRLSSYFTGVEDDKASLRIKLSHMPIYLAWAGSAVRLANKPIKYVIFDETDKYPPTPSKREADSISLGEKRTITYQYDHKIIKLSTPTIEAAPIWEAFTNEAQEVFDFWVKCPSCGEYQIMQFEQIKWPPDERDPERVEAGFLAWYECEHCKAVWREPQRDTAVRNGEWRAKGTGLGLFKHLEAHRPTKIGFHIPSWISSFTNLSKPAGAFLRGLHDKNKLKDFNNNHKAVPWKVHIQEREEEKILALCDDRPRGLVPGGGVVAALTAGVDTQDDGFFYEIRAWGWGLTLESWGIREGFVDTFEALAQILFLDQYKDADGNEYHVHLVAHDAMGHRTSEVYDFSRKHKGRLFAFKGEQRMSQPYRFSNIEFYPGKHKQKPIPGGIKLLRADVTYFKNTLANKLEIAPADPGAWHMHSETTQDWAQQMCAEYVDEKGLWQCPDGKANHAWDCSIYNLVAAEVIGVRHWAPEGPRQHPKNGTKKAKLKVVRSKWMGQR